LNYINILMKHLRITRSGAFGSTAQIFGLPDYLLRSRRAGLRVNRNRPPQPRAPARETSRSKKHHDAHLGGADVPIRRAMRAINAQRTDGSTVRSAGSTMLNALAWLLLTRSTDESASMTSRLSYSSKSIHLR
jgi:hypothetical protein